MDQNVLVFGFGLLLLCIFGWYFFTDSDRTKRILGSILTVLLVAFCLQVVNPPNVGDALGLTFQQVQKYEKGTNRIGASRLQQISQILQVPVSFFFDGAPHVPGSARSEGMGEAPSPAYVSDFLATSDGLALTKAFMRISDSKLRRRIVDLVEQIASSEKR